MHQPDEKSLFKSALELLAIVGPIICLIDCLVIPIMMAALPFVGAQHIFHGLSDQIQAIIVLCICLPVLIPGFLKHRRKRVLALMSLGFALIFFTNFAGHDIDNTLHTLITITGCLFLIKANFDNKHFSKCSNCHKSDMVPVVIDKEP